jgi:ribosomal protein L16 Arg81 hydroxylase
MLECLLEPGDALFLPVGWWHYVESLDASISLTFTVFERDNDFYSRYTTTGTM